LHFIIISDVKETIIETVKWLQFNKVVLNYSKPQTFYFLKITQWPKIYQDKLKYEFILPSFPNVSNPQEWKNAYQPCSAQRLFVHVRMNDFPIIICYFVVKFLTMCLVNSPKSWCRHISWYRHCFSFTSGRDLVTF
jgi:hypothetical protein